MTGDLGDRTLHAVSATDDIGISGIVDGHRAWHITAVIPTALTRAFTRRKTDAIFGSLGNPTVRRGPLTDCALRGIRQPERRHCIALLSDDEATSVPIVCNASRISIIESGSTLAHGPGKE